MFRISIVGNPSASRSVSRPRQTVVTAWYDPRNPSESVLTRTPNPVLLVITVAMMFFAGIAWWVAGRSGK